MVDVRDDEDDAPRRLPFESPLLSANDLRLLLRRRERDGVALGIGLVLDGVVSSKDWVEWLTEMTGLPRFSDTDLESLDKSFFAGFPEELIFDAGCMPLFATEEGRWIGFIDPAAPGLLREVELFAAADVQPCLLGADQVARVYHRIFGRRWRIAPDATPAGRDGETEAIGGLLTAVHTLEIELQDAIAEGLDDLVVVHVGPDGVPTELALTRSRRTVAATLDRAGGPVLTQAERPRVKSRTLGSSRHYLDPTQEGEAVVLTESRKAEPDAGPSIIIDDALLNETEAEAQQSSGSGSIILDPSLFAAPEPEPEPGDEDDDESDDGESVRKVSVPTQVKLGQRRAKEALRDSELGLDIDIHVETGEFDLTDVPLDDPSAEWIALDQDLDAIDAGTTTLDEGIDALIEGTDEMDWPFELDDDGDNPFGGTGSGSEKRAVEPPRSGITIGPVAGEITIESEPTVSQKREDVWFDPRTEGASGARVPDDLRSQLRALREAPTYEDTFKQLARTITRVYKRSIVFRLASSTAIPLAYDSERTWDKFVDPDRAVTVSDVELPILDRLTLMGKSSFMGELSSDANKILTDLLPGGAALSSVITPVELSDRVVLLLYGDHGPGREARREPELWRLMLRESPRALMRLNTLRKKRFRWETKFQ